MADDRAPGNEVSFPPPPWRLFARAVVGLWRVPVPELPSSFADVYTVGGNAVVAVAAVRYGAGSTLTYRELLVAGWRGGVLPPRITIGAIWVDNAAACAGGRALWSIPKELGALSFDEDGDDVAAGLVVDGAAVADVSFAAGPALPLRFRATISVVQDAGIDGMPGAVTRVRASARVRSGFASWRMSQRGPLGFLDERAPALTVGLDDARVVFG